MKRLRSLFEDFIALAGLASLTYGVWEWWAPAGPMIFGLGLVFAVRYGGQPKRSD